MNIFIDTERELVIVSTNTKASKWINRNWESIGVKKVIENVRSGYGKVVIDFSVFGYNEQVTATKYLKDLDISVEWINERFIN